MWYATIRNFSSDDSKGYSLTFWTALDTPLPPFTRQTTPQQSCCFQPFLLLQTTRSQWQQCGATTTVYTPMRRLQLLLLPQVQVQVQLRLDAVQKLRVKPFQQRLSQRF
mmetsp:Transcript_29796/g.59798  ORF Transcript_29796/g.59798 Transcript_29796/m.59798 type:complete len:109 (-) Transcript_29796:651-977(-)